MESVYPLKENLHEQLKQMVDLFPDREAVRFENSYWTYKELWRDIEKTASALKEHGVKENDIVAVALPNCPAAVHLLYAINKLGAISYNIHPLTPGPQMRDLIMRVGCKRLIAIALQAAEYREALPQEVEVISLNPYRHVNPIKVLAVHHMAKKAKGLISYASLKGHEKVPSISKKADDDAVYLNTGGTNGEPKVVRLSNRAINSLGLKGYPLIGGGISSLHMLTAIPLFHGFGLAMGVHTVLINGISTVLMLKFNTKEAIKHIRKGRATIIIGVPALYNALLSRPSFYGPWLEKQVVAFVGGDSVPQALMDRWNQTMEKYGSPARIYEGYGLTETVTVSNVNTLFAHKRGSVGKALPGLEEIVIDVDSGKVLGPNQPGELLIRGDQVMNGYYKDEKTTSESFIEIDGKTYYRTRDYVTMDEEGYVTFKQRLRRTAKINGETLCPSDVEDVVLRNDDIYECFCYAVPDERKGQVFRLAIVLNRNKELDAEKVKKETLERIAASLAPSYKPDRIDVLKELPHTPVGKIDPVAFAKLVENND